MKCIAPENVRLYERTYRFNFHDRLWKAFPFTFPVTMFLNFPGAENIPTWPAFHFRSAKLLRARIALLSRHSSTASNLFVLIFSSMRFSSGYAPWGAAPLFLVNIISWSVNKFRVSLGKLQSTSGRVNIKSYLEVIIKVWKYTFHKDVCTNSSRLSICILKR